MKPTNLAGSDSATAFVGWYNGHPHHHRRAFELSARRAVVIGNGNVALDVARMLVLHPDELSCTDAADHAISTLLGEPYGRPRVKLLRLRDLTLAAASPLSGMGREAQIRRSRSGVHGIRYRRSGRQGWFEVTLVEPEPVLGRRRSVAKPPVAVMTGWSSPSSLQAGEASLWAASPAGLLRVNKRT